MIDSHCHLDFDYSPKNLDDLLHEARLAGMKALMTVGTELEKIKVVQSISEKYAEVFHSVGVHPHEAKTLTDAGLEQIRQAALHSKCKAIGEIGLDYYYLHSSQEEQKKALTEQLLVAKALKLPVIIHSRDAEADLLPILLDHARQVAHQHALGVLHCFTGTKEFGESCLKAGYFISFSGIVTFKKAEAVQKCAKDFPLQKLLIETDSPFLAPVPFRGKKCEPSMVKLVAEKIAELKGTPLEEVLKVTTENATQLFNVTL